MRCKQGLSFFAIAALTASFASSACSDLASGKDENIGVGLGFWRTSDPDHWKSGLCLACSYSDSQNQGSLAVARTVWRAGGDEVYVWQLTVGRRVLRWGRNAGLSVGATGWFWEIPSREYYDYYTGEYEHPKGVASSLCVMLYQPISRDCALSVMHDFRGDTGTPFGGTSIRLQFQLR